MGYAVLHLEKAKGAGSGMSAHIERTIQPKNADPTRTHLNRELIQFPDGVRNRTAAIQHRLDTAGLRRKIGKNQVQAIRIVLTGTHADMERIEQTGRLDEWSQDNLDWLRKTYGADNVVSAVLHMDEETPHIHATIVPIVQTERKKQKGGGRDVDNIVEGTRNRPTNCYTVSASIIVGGFTQTSIGATFLQIMSRHR